MEPDDVPARTPPHLTAPVRTQADLLRTWRMLMGRLGFGDRTLWTLLLGPDGEVLPQLLTIDELPVEVDVDGAQAWVEALRHARGCS